MRRRLLPLLGFLSAGCGAILNSGDATLDQLKARASFDMDCPKSEIRTVTIDDRTRGVSGCGQHLTYVESCQTVTGVGLSTTPDDCTWVLNTDARRHKNSGDDGD